MPVLVMRRQARRDVDRAASGPVLFVAAQLWLAAFRSLAVVAADGAPGDGAGVRRARANFWGDATDTWPLSALAVPVVALAAATGGRGPTIVAFAGMALILAPLALPTVEGFARQEVSAVAMAAVVVAIGSRRVVANLERSSTRLRRANNRARRRARELAAVE